MHWDYKAYLGQILKKNGTTFIPFLYHKHCTYIEVYHYQDSQ